MRPALLSILLFHLLSGHHVSTDNLHVGSQVLHYYGKQQLVSSNANRNLRLYSFLHSGTTAEYMTAEEMEDEEDNLSLKKGKARATSALAIEHVIHLGRLHNRVRISTPASVITSRRYILQKTLRI